MALNLTRFFKGRPAADSVVTDNKDPDSLSGVPLSAEAQDGSGVDNANRSAAPGSPHASTGFMMQDGEPYPRGLKLGDIEGESNVTAPGGTASGDGLERSAPAGAFFDKQNMPLDIPNSTGSDGEVGAPFAGPQSANLIDTSTGEIVWAAGLSTPDANALVQNQNVDMLWRADPLAAGNTDDTNDAARHAGPGAPHEAQGFIMRDGELYPRGLKHDSLAGEEGDAGRHAGPGYPRGIKFDGVDGESNDAARQAGPGAPGIAEDGALAGHLGVIGRDLPPGTEPDGLLPYLEQSNLVGTGSGHHSAGSGVPDGGGSEQVASTSEQFSLNFNSIRASQSEVATGAGPGAGPHVSEAGARQAADGDFRPPASGFQAPSYEVEDVTQEVVGAPSANDLKDVESQMSTGHGVSLGDTGTHAIGEGASDVLAFRREAGGLAAEAQDGSGTDNANHSAGPAGIIPIAMDDGLRVTGHEAEGVIGLGEPPSTGGVERGAGGHGAPHAQHGFSAGQDLRIDSLSRASDTPGGSATTGHFSALDADADAPTTLLDLHAHGADADGGLLAQQIEVPHHMPDAAHHIGDGPHHDVGGVHGHGHESALDHLPDIDI